MKNISIKEIAELSGVSVATVSRVINDNGRFSEETRIKVEKVIKEHGYKRNTIAKSLRMKKTDTIGILVPDISNSFFAKVVEQTERILFEKGYATIICNTARSKEKEDAYIKMLEGKMIDGLLVISGFKEFDSNQITGSFPVICIDRKPSKNSNIILIESDHFRGGYLAAQELISKKCKHISIVIHNPFLSSSQERLQGFSKALQDAGIEVNKDYILFLEEEDGLSRTESAKNIVKESLLHFPQIDGIFAINDRLAIGAIHASHEIGKKVGENIKIVGFDNDSVSKYCYPRLTTIRQDVEKIAQLASESLLQLIRDPKMKIAQHKVVDVDIIKRETT